MSRPRTLRLLLVVATAVATAASIAAIGPVQAASTGSSTTYLVVASSGASSTAASAAVTRAGGTLVASYPQIGVAVARSDQSDFAAVVGRSAGIQGAVATAKYATTLHDDLDSTSTDGAAPTTPAWGDSLSSLQWDMTNIQVPEAHQLNQGSPDVLVGDLDTGLDFTHPDLAANYDAADSTDCTSGSPTALGVGNDQAGHGTHTAGTIAAAANGLGIVGVAPGVRIAGVKAGNDAGFFFPEAVVCSFMWAATHGFDVTNNSYFADPWYMNCKTDPEQRAIWTAERRAIQFAQSRGTLVVAAEGNFADDLSHPTLDAQSPDNGAFTTREVTNACAVVPVEVPGVIGVSATGPTHMKSFYSSYGISTVDVAAPGGDSRNIDGTTNGRVLSTWPSGVPCARRVSEGAATYCYQQGTSMASPHVAGLAALALSAHPGLSSHAVEALLQQTATPLACPDTSLPLYANFPNQNDLSQPQQCTGGTGHNSFYGAGEVNALRAVQ